MRCETMKLNVLLPTYRRKRKDPAPPAAAIKSHFKTQRAQRRKGRKSVAATFSNVDTSPSWPRKIYAEGDDIKGWHCTDAKAPVRKGQGLQQAQDLTAEQRSEPFGVGAGGGPGKGRAFRGRCWPRSRKRARSMNENDLSHAVIGAAIEVHREIGPGILEKSYEEAMCHELHLRGLPFVRQQVVPFIYKGIKLSADLRADLIVAGKLVVDLKAKEQVLPIDKLKVLTYLRLLDLRLGLIINFHVGVLKDGIYRVVNNLYPPDPPPEPPDLHS
jgi:GxxExxY protein